MISLHCAACLLKVRLTTVQCNLSRAFSARQVKFLELYIDRKISIKFAHVNKMHPFLKPAVLGQNCAYYSRDFTVTSVL